MVLTSRLRAIERVHPVHAMNAEQCQMVWGWMWVGEGDGFGGRDMGLGREMVWGWEMGWEGDIVFC